MEANVWADWGFLNRRREGTVPFRRGNSAGVTPRSQLSVMVLYADPVIAAGLAAVLHENPSFQNVPAPQAGELLFGPPPADVVVADYETAIQLAESSSQWAENLVVFTNYDSEARICRALESGARGYLLYGIGLLELFEGIRAVHEGGVAISPLVATRITNRIKGKALTAREKAVLEHLMLGLSNKGIARRLNLTVGTVKTHVKSIMAKLNAKSRTAAVITAHRTGLLP
jgi:DNA-binding NarL/FixJ family response regulator